MSRGISNIKLSPQILPSTTAGIVPEKFSDDLIFAGGGKIAALILAVLMIAGFALRVGQLGAESLGEDELNKLQTVEEYRKNGLSGRNGEHPFLMKGLQTVSVAASEKLNVGLGTPISVEAALRFPIALFGTLTILLMFLLVKELFGRSIGLVSAALWAVEPAAIGFDRIAKEDSLALFFFLLTTFFWVKGQSAAERGDATWPKYAWLAATSFAAMMASKYYPHLLAVLVGYYFAFQFIPATKWRMEKVRFAKFLLIMGVSFVILSPTILIPETWREMLKYSSESRIGHDSYEFMGGLYGNKLSLWLAGVPWTFYYVFIGVKTSLSTLALFIVGLPVIFRRKMGDGRLLLFFWALMWFMPFSVMGGKFTRYFAMAEPLILIVAAAGFCISVRWLVSKLQSPLSQALEAILLAAIIAIPLWNSISVKPHFRMFTNSIGGAAAAGTFFPHDEFYDASTREIVQSLVPSARTGGSVACETPTLFEYYAGGAGREDLRFVSLSDKAQVGSLLAGDVIVIAKGRRYRSNAALDDYLESMAAPTAETRINDVISARVYVLNETTLERIRELSR